MQYHPLISEEEEVLIEEKQLNGSNGTYLFIRQCTSDNLVISLRNSTHQRNYGLVYLKKVFCDILLPQGYPTTVSLDYSNYQIWDTVQAFCSTISSTLTTHAIFKGVGVGDQNATALAATITWILKDGTGMIGRIGFAWWKGFALDTDCKKWRLVADLMNDIAMCFELLLGFVLFKNYSSIILCISMGMKSIVGVAGGATRAAITQHQAIRGNMGDVSAKDGSQETCVNLLASFLGVFLLTRIENDISIVWTLFFFNTALHLFANYKAVKSLILRTVNSSRLLLITKHFLLHNDACSPESINRKESVFLGFGSSDELMCSKKIRLGYSLKKCAENKYSSLNTHSLKKLKQIYHSFPYLMSYSERYIDVMLHENISDEDVIKAYFHALILGVVINWPHSDNPSNQFHSKFLNLIQKCRLTKLCDVYVNIFIQENWEELATNLRSNGWNLKIHQLVVQEFRIKLC